MEEGAEVITVLQLLSCVFPKTLFFIFASQHQMDINFKKYKKLYNDVSLQK